MKELIWAGLGFNPRSPRHGPWARTLEEQHEAILDMTEVIQQDHRHDIDPELVTFGISAYRYLIDGIEMADIFNRDDIRIGFGAITTTTEEGKTILPRVRLILEGRHKILGTSTSVWVFPLPAPRFSIPKKVALSSSEKL